MVLSFLSNVQIVHNVQKRTALKSLWTLRPPGVYIFEDFLFHIRKLSQTAVESKGIKVTFFFQKLCLRESNND